MIYILDTDLFTLSERHDSPEFVRLHARVAQLPQEDAVVTTIVTYEEQTRGWLAYAAKSRAIPHQIKAYAKLKRHLMAYLNIGVLDFDSAAGTQLERLLNSRVRIGTSDLKIASITLANNATLLSRNLSDFRKVPGLRVEDWSKD